MQRNWSYFPWFAKNPIEREEILIQRLEEKTKIIENELEEIKDIIQSLKRSRIDNQASIPRNYLRKEVASNYSEQRFPQRQVIQAKQRIVSGEVHFKDTIPCLDNFIRKVEDFTSIRVLKQIQRDGEKRSETLLHHMKENWEEADRVYFYCVLPIDRFIEIEHPLPADIAGKRNVIYVIFRRYYSSYSNVHLVSWDSPPSGIHLDMHDPKKKFILQFKFRESENMPEGMQKDSGFEKLKWACDLMLNPKSYSKQ